MENFHVTLKKIKKNNNKSFMNNFFYKKYFYFQNYFSFLQFDFSLLSTPFIRVIVRP